MSGLEEKKTITLVTLGDTELFGRRLGEFAQQGDIILLSGPLGAGKTTLTQGIARGLEVPEEYYVTSPSYNLLHEYPGRIPLYHIDCYRLETEEDVEGAGLLDYLPSNGLSVVEWPERLGALSPSVCLELVFMPGEGDVRHVVLQAYSGAWQGRLAKITSSFS